MTKERAGLLRLAWRAGPRSLRAQLSLLTVSILAPALVCMAALLWLAIVETRASHERELLATARALSAAIDQDLAMAMAANDVLSTSDAVALGDWQTLRRRAARTTGARASMALHDAEGRRIFNTSPAAGRDPAPTSWTIPPSGAVRTSGSVISDLIDDVETGRRVVSVETTLAVDGQRFRLSQVMDPKRFLSLPAMRAVQPPTMVSVVDRQNRIVARTRKHDELLGASATGTMIEALRTSREGVVRSRSLEGVPTVVAFTRSPVSGWATLVVMPRVVFEAPMYRNLLGLVLVSLLILGFGATVAYFYSRTIAHELAQLQADAAALGQGKLVEGRDGQISDFAQVQAALVRASQELSARSDRQRLMINELNHRVKNTLATVQSLAIQTFRGADPDAPAKFDTRLAALASGHDLLTQTNWKDVDLQGVIGRCAAPGDSRLTAEGPVIALPPQAAIALCMVLHELTTNSLKYGALSSTTGVVAVSWTLEDQRLSLTWRESGGPRVSTPKRSGFGTRLIDRLLRHELDGEATRVFEPEGMIFVARISLAATSRWNNDFET